MQNNFFYLNSLAVHGEVWFYKDSNPTRTANRSLLEVTNQPTILKLLSKSNRQKTVWVAFGVVQSIL